MTDDEARTLATRFIDTWPAGSRAYVWRDLFAELEPGLAVDAYHRLQRDCDKAPTPGQFHAAYRAALARAKSIDDAPAVCELCDGTGWVQAADLIEQIAGEPHPYSQVTPCRCSIGERMRPVHASILEHNRR